MQREWAHCVLLKRVDPLAPAALGFVGDLYAAGQVVELREGKPIVVLECAGKQGAWVRGKHQEVLWILWRYDSRRSGWAEIARAFGYGSEWATILRKPAIDALRPARPELFDILGRSGSLIDEMAALIDNRLALELPEVRKLVLSELYVRVASRIAEG